MCCYTFFRSLLLFRVLQTAKIEITTWICISNFVCQIWLNVCVAVFCQWLFSFDRKLFFSLLSTFYCSSAHVFFSGVRRKIEMVPLSKLNCVFFSKWKTIALVSTDHVESVKMECQVGVSMADEWMNEIFLLMDGVCARRWIEKWKSFQIKFNMWWNWR